LAFYCQAFSHEQKGKRRYVLVTSRKFFLKALALQLVSSIHIALHATQQGLLQTSLKSLSAFYELVTYGKEALVQNRHAMNESCLLLQGLSRLRIDLIQKRLVSKSTPDIHPKVVYSS
jgi:hypothetical protein